MPQTPPDAHRTDIQVRFGDTDALGHLNNVSFIGYAELGRLHFVASLAGEARSLILARVAADFRKQVRFGERVVVCTWVERVGTTSVTLQQSILANDALAAEVSSVVVSFDYAANMPTPWSPEARRYLEANVRDTAPTATGA